MSKYNRYLFVKKMYPDYVVFVKDKDSLNTFDDDLLIVKLKGLEYFFELEINYIILDKLDLNFYKFTNNNYFYYFKISLIKKVLDFIVYDFI